MHILAFPSSVFCAIFQKKKIGGWKHSYCAILATIWSSETNFENPKRFIKSVVFDRWFDMFTDRRLMAVVIKKNYVTKL